MLLIARTDSESGKLLSSTVDVVDHPFILGRFRTMSLSSDTQTASGTTAQGSKALSQEIAKAEARGATGAEINDLEATWTAQHEMCTFDQGEWGHI